MVTPELIPGLHASVPICVEIGVICVITNASSTICFTFGPGVRGSYGGSTSRTPLLVEVDGEEEYQVYCVEDGRVYRNQLRYLILWRGYESLIWEPAKCVDGS